MLSEAHEVCFPGHVVIRRMKFYCTRQEKLHALVQRIGHISYIRALQVSTDGIGVNRSHTTDDMRAVRYKKYTDGAQRSATASSPFLIHILLTSHCSTMFFIEVAAPQKWFAIAKDHYIIHTVVSDYARYCSIRVSSLLCLRGAKALQQHLSSLVPTWNRILKWSSKWTTLCPFR